MKHIKDNFISDYIIVFFASFFPRLILSVNPGMRLIQDEIGMLAIPSYLAGYDWSSVISNTKYYGFGYYFFYTPFFRIVDNPYILYFIMLIGAGILYSFTSVIALYIIRNLFNLKERFFSIIVSISMSFTIITAARILQNEAPIMLGFWVLIICLLFLVKNKQKNKRIIPSIVFSITIIYLQTIHTRCTVLLFALIIVCLLYRIIYKKALLSWYFILIIGIMFGVVSVSIKYVQSTIWQTNTNSLVNSSDAVTGYIYDSLHNVLNPGFIRAFLDIIFGNMYTLLILSCCFFSITLVIVFQMLFHPKIKEENVETEMIWVISFFTITVILISIIGLALIWAPKIEQAIYDNGNTYYYKALTYIRYYGSYTGPLFLVSIISIKKKLVNNKKSIIASIILSIAIIAIWYICILPYSYTENSVLNIFSALNGYDDVRPRYRYYVLATFTSVAISIILLYFCYIKETTISLILLCIFFSFQSCYLSKSVSIQKAENVDASYRIISQLENQIDLPKKIYCVNSSFQYPYQFFLKKYTIVNGYPTENEYAIVLSNSPNNDQLVGFSQYTLNNYEYIYVNEPQINNILSSYIEKDYIIQP